MNRILLTLICLTFIVFALGCSGGKTEEPPPGITGKTPTPVAEKPKGPTPEEKWLMETCGSCHEANLEETVEKMKALSTEEFETVLASEVHAGLELDDEAKTKLLDFHKAWAEKMAQKEAMKKESAEGESPEGETSEGGTE